MTFIILHNFKRFLRYDHTIFKFKNIWPISKGTWDEVLMGLLKVNDTTDTQKYDISP
jgi:hypothetical protein